MKKYRVEFGGIVEVTAENVDEALENAAYQCLSDPTNIMGLRMCEDQDDEIEEDPK